jgi:hypothetical protein
MIPGVNIQWPWSELLLSGEKTVETRSYPLPKKYENEWLAVIETPGPRGRKEAGIEKARITGVIKFSTSFRYRTKREWLADYGRHCVEDGDPQFGFATGKEKWGWLVSDYYLFKQICPPPQKRGIIFASRCQLPYHVQRDFAR